MKEKSGKKKNTENDHRDDKNLINKLKENSWKIIKAV
jgi:hypothetical protein